MIIFVMEIDYVRVGIENSLNGRFYCEYGFDIK